MPESLLLAMNAIVQENLEEFVSIDIRAAFLNGKIEREVYVRPPKDLRKPGKLWRLNKLLYGINDASRGFWKLVKNLFKELGLVPVAGDEAFYQKREEGKLVCVCITHVDDFTVGSTTTFLKTLIDSLNNKLKISKVEKNEFRVTGIDFKRTENGEINLDMQAYADSLEPIKEFRKVADTQTLTSIEQKIYRKLTGRLSWLANNVRPDICYNVLQLSKKSHSPTMADLKQINKVIEKIKNKPNKISVKQLGKKEDLKILAVTDASYKPGEKSISGQIIMLGNTKNEKANILYWKSKQIDRVCESSKDAECRSLSIIIDSARFLTDQLESVMFGKTRRNLKIEIYTDNVPNLQSIASTKQVQVKLLRNAFASFRQNLETGDIDSYSWLDAQDMIADVLTKDKNTTKNQDDKLDELIQKNEFKRSEKKHNLVKFEREEILFKNQREKTRKIDDAWMKRNSDDAETFFMKLKDWLSDKFSDA